MAHETAAASGRNPALTPRPTTIVEAPRLAARLGVDLFLAVETFQQTGSFKFRAAANVAANVPNETLIAASSGNFGQALARAAQLAGKRAIIVMPATSAKVKVEAVRQFGGEVVFVDTKRETRAAKVAEVFAATSRRLSRQRLRRSAGDLAATPRWPMSSPRSRAPAARSTPWSCRSAAAA